MVTDLNTYTCYKPGNGKQNNHTHVVVVIVFSVTTPWRFL